MKYERAEITVYEAEELVQIEAAGGGECGVLDGRLYPSCKGTTGIYCQSTGRICNFAYNVICDGGLSIFCEFTQFGCYRTSVP